MTIGDRISMLRRSRDLSQEELAELCGVSRQAVSKWESEQSIPEIDKIMTLSEAFGVSTDYILKGIEPLGERPDRKNHPAKPFNIVATAVIFCGMALVLALFLSDYDSSAQFNVTLLAFVFIVIGLTVFALGSVRLPKREQKRNALTFIIPNVWIIAMFVFSLIYNALAVHAVAPYPLAFTDSTILRYQAVGGAVDAIDRIPVVTQFVEDGSTAAQGHDDRPSGFPERQQTFEPSYYATLPDWVKHAGVAAFVVIYVLTCAGTTVYCAFEIEKERKSGGEDR